VKNKPQISNKELYKQRTSFSFSFSSAPNNYAVRKYSSPFQLQSGKIDTNGN
jgi:hypothetical protein